MTFTALVLIAVFLMGFADMYRGAKAGLPRAFEKAILGALALFVLGGVAIFSSWQFVLAYLVAFSIGASVSWGAVISGSLKKDSPEKFQAHVDAKQDKGDWYLVGWFRKSPMRGLFARSMVWGLPPALVIGWFVGILPAVAMFLTYTAAMPLAVKFLHAVDGSKFDNFIGKVCLKLVDKDRSWARHEMYRGWIAGLILLAFSLAFSI